MDTSNSKEIIKSSDSQPLATLEDPKGCQDVATNHQQDVDIKKTAILHQEPKGRQDIAKNHQKDDYIKKEVILHQDPKECRDIAQDHHGVIKKTVILHQDPEGSRNIVQDHLKDDLVKSSPSEKPENQERLVVRRFEEVVPEDDDDGFKTPTSLESKIPVVTTCPPAPKRPSGIKRKASQQRSIRIIRITRY